MILAGVLAICLLTLLAAYGGESSTPQNTGPETTAIEPVLIPAGYISTLLTVDDVSVLAGGVGLATHQLDLKSMARVWTRYRSSTSSRLIHCPSIPRTNREG